MARQSGKSTTILAYLLLYIIFNENVSVAILANKKTTAMELLGRLQLYEHGQMVATRSFDLEQR